MIKQRGRSPGISPAAYRLWRLSGSPAKSRASRYGRSVADQSKSIGAVDDWLARNIVPQGFLHLDSHSHAIRASLDAWLMYKGVGQ